MYPLRSITFVAELIHAQAAHPMPHLQKVHHLAFSSSNAAYANFQVIPGGAQLSNPVPKQGAVSSALILPDRLRIQEQMTGISREDFQARVNQMGRYVLDELSVTGFVAQQFLVQSLINPRSVENAAEFMSRSLLHFPEGALERFDRPAGLLGLRFSFPMSQEHPSLFNVRIETYDRDSRSLFLETTGVFRQAIKADNLEDLASLFTRTYEFLENRVLGFVAQFDQKEFS